MVRLKAFLRSVFPPFKLLRDEGLLDMRSHTWCARVVLATTDFWAVLSISELDPSYLIPSLHSKLMNSS